jgi:hypothetical protein
MIVLNLDELQAMGLFCYEVALLEQPDTKIYAYEHGDNRNCYILVVPLEFYSSRSRSFIELVCLCSQSVTIPAEGDYLGLVEQLLAKFGLRWRKKKGNSVIKIYIEKDCWNSYLDLVTFQAVQFKGNSCKDLIAMKKQNAYEYCLSSFREELLPAIFQAEEDRVESALECCTQEIKEIFLSL